MDTFHGWSLANFAGLLSVRFANITPFFFFFTRRILKCNKYGLAFPFLLPIQRSIAFLLQQPFVNCLYVLSILFIARDLTSFPVQIFGFQSRSNENLESVESRSVLGELIRLVSTNFSPTLKLDPKSREWKFGEEGGD